MPKVSIIIPVYNPGSYLAKTLDSILSQDFEDLELLLADDGSTDGSASVCDQYAREDPRVRVFHLENGGTCKARNYALGKAEGEYVTFSDDDDLFLPGHLRSNYELAKRTDADCVRFGRIVVTEIDGKVVAVTKMGPSEERLLVGDQIFDDCEPFRQVSQGVWAGMFRRSLLDEEGIRFDERINQGEEDTLFLLEVLKHARRIAFNPVMCYAWFHRTNQSSSFHQGENFFFAARRVVDTKYELMKEHGIDKKKPEFFVARLLYTFWEVAQTVFLSMPETWEAERKAYERLHDIYQPYFPELLDKPCSPVDRTACRLLARERYGLLALCLHVGGNLKLAEQRVSRTNAASSLDGILQGD